MAETESAVGKDPRLINLQITVPSDRNAEIVKSRLAEFVIGPRMPGWDDPTCYSFKEQLDGIQVQKCE